MVAVVGPPGESLRKVVALLRDVAPESLNTLRLGGGTALAAMWCHRYSTDVDFACGDDTFERLCSERLPLLEALRELHRRGVIRRPTFAGRMIAWTYRDSGEVSLVRRFGAGDDLLSGVTEDATNVPLVSPARILHAKLVGRVLEGGKLLARDGYDLAYAFEHHAAVMSRTLAPLTDNQKSLMKEIATTIPASRQRILDGRPLRECRQPTMAFDPWRSFARSYQQFIDSTGHKTAEILSLALTSQPAQQGFV